MRPIKTTLSALAVLGLTLSPALAQDTTSEAPATEAPAAEAPTTEAPATEAPAAEAPAATAPAPIVPPEPYIGATHGDWALRCLPNPEGPDPCRMYQSLLNGDGNRISEVSVFPIASGGSAVAGMVVATPLETFLPAGLRMTIDDGETGIYPYRNCAPSGCYVRIGLTAEELAQMKAGNVAKIQINPLAAPEKIVTVTVSLKGFTAAYQAVVDQIAPAASE